MQVNSELQTLAGLSPGVSAAIIEKEVGRRLELP
jgi:hypothetical protein